MAAGGKNGLNGGNSVADGGCNFNLQTYKKVLLEKIYTVIN